MKSITEINETLIGDHAKQVTRMLPGGTHVLGIFVTSSEDLLAPFHSKLKTVLQVIHKLLDAPKYLYGNASSEKLIVNYNNKTLKWSCKAYDVVTHNVHPADLKFLNKETVWRCVECDLDVDYLRYLNTKESEWPIQKHIEVKLYFLLNIP